MLRRKEGRQEIEASQKPPGREVYYLVSIIPNAADGDKGGLRIDHWISAQKVQRPLTRAVFRGRMKANTLKTYTREEVLNSQLQFKNPKDKPWLTWFK